jgi:hypothetical protein
MLKVFLEVHNDLFPPQQWLNAIYFPRAIFSLMYRYASGLSLPTYNTRSGKIELNSFGQLACVSVHPVTHSEASDRHASAEFPNEMSRAGPISGQQEGFPGDKS